MIEEAEPIQKTLQKAKETWEVGKRWISFQQSQKNTPSVKQLANSLIFKENFSRNRKKYYN